MTRTKTENLSGVVQGDSPTYSLKLTDENGNNKDITGWEVHMTLKKNRDIDDANAEVIMNNAGDGGANITNATAGEAEIDYTESDTNNLEGDYYYKIWVIKESGDKHTIIKGEVPFVEA